MKEDIYVDSRPPLEPFPHVCISPTHKHIHGYSTHYIINKKVESMLLGYYTVPHLKVLFYMDAMQLGYASIITSFSSSEIKWLKHYDVFICSLVFFLMLGVELLKL